MSTYILTGKGDFVDIFSVEAEKEKKAYLEGAVELVLEGKVVLDKNLWDDVEFIWWGLVDMAVGFKGEGSMDFPDQPISVTLVRKERGWLKFEVKSLRGGVISASSVKEEEFFHLLKSEGMRTLSRLLVLNPANADSHDRALAKLAALGIP